MRFHPPLLTLSTLIVALASFAMLVAVPPRGADVHAPVDTHLGKPHALPLEMPS